MVFRRGQRPSFYFQARTRYGWQQLCTHAKDRKLAEKIVFMWSELADDHRAFDVLDRVLAGDLNAAELFDLWRSEAIDRNLPALRTRLRDADLAPLVDEFLDIYGKRFPRAVGHVRAHLRALLPEGDSLLISQATPEYLTRALYAHGHRRSAEGPLVPSSRNTLRKVHANWSLFFEYCVRPKGLFQRSPMLEVERPPLERKPVEFYDLDTIERIVAWQPTPERRAIFALLYGGAIEVTPALTLRRADLDPAAQEVRVPGEKAHTRDRMCRMVSWAWAILWTHARSVLPLAPIFPPSWTRHQVHDWHSAAIKALEIRPVLKPYASRHAWAARWLRAGTPIEVVQQQLGHASPMLTLSTYGRFLPGASDRAEWERKVTANEVARRDAK